MAIIGKFYDEKTRTDKVWYDSSNVFYSKFVENENNNLGQLYVTFKNGATYLYKDVDMITDYLLFKSGGIDNSQGKALNKQIKGKYEYERVGDENINVLLEELNRINNQEEENDEVLSVGKFIEILQKYPADAEINLVAYPKNWGMVPKTLSKQLTNECIKEEGGKVYIDSVIDIELL